MYRAIKNKDIQFSKIFTTDGRIHAYNLVALKDDKHFYPSY
ncbi:glycine betaine ABC transporter substrate-binding protein [Candidatus Coxiella mudrowiae]|nr:glycine betaine ABC transporter substrate-binding protein [Candidatus Coxiella mudrowiae]